ncbi:MotA/TolQ/ExbB proton channel family protein [Desulfolithobacter sp.]
MAPYELLQQGGVVMWPLLACSILVLTVILERSLFWLAIRQRRDRQLVDEILRMAEEGQWDRIRAISRGSRDHVVRVLIVGILHRHYDMTRAMEAEARQQLRRMERFMILLDTMITVAPLLGILGTVLGIISSFQMLGTGGVTDPKLVTGGIAQALLTTAAGLTISIVTVFPYNFFRSRIDHAAHVMEKYATGLEVVWNKTSHEIMMLP